MRRLLTRRKLLVSGLATAAGASGVGAAVHIADRYGLIPPDSGGIFGVGETLTYAAQRLLTSGQSLAREFDRSNISKVHPVNGIPPVSEGYRRLLRDGFRDWRLAVDGLVARPSFLSLEELRRLPDHSQITLHVCEEGWSFIAEWTGVQLSYLLDLVGTRPEARYVVFYPFSEFERNTWVWWDSLDMADALHPQTLIAYGMNGVDLPTEHGAPVRLRVARQLGYKSIKYLYRMTVTDSLANIGRGLGGAPAEAGYSWYAGI
jgi:DMSO/TMAO reductase YedYZ molybdopterin-dependent catalytic subunit